MRNRIHVLPDFGYDTINVSSGNTVKLFPARSRPSTYFRAYPSCLIMSRSNFTLGRTPKLIHRGPVEIPARDLSDAGQRDEGGLNRERELIGRCGRHRNASMQRQRAACIRSTDAGQRSCSHVGGNRLGSRGPLLASSLISWRSRAIQVGAQ